ncbi:MAG: hypothetical protein MUP68_06875, partial [Deltaproteobacteria bacterium]|nr:hypothetical protein [Deltaproteobacteria bacterium]
QRTQLDKGCRGIHQRDWPVRREPGNLLEDHICNFPIQRMDFFLGKIVAVFEVQYHPQDIVLPFNILSKI